ncbi:hypothetical protein ACHAXA_003346 [Cyclostephanos tholiformis]|uniref:Uncharacterized protein n=1 Tax=Cyclostephanos tholiformis TaxID=382380 RepID=A0ABD3RG39_9STRA
MSPREEDSMMSGEVEESMEVLPLAAMPRYYEQMKEDGTSVVYHEGRIMGTDGPCEGALRLSELVDRLEAHNAMSFDERIKAMQISKLTSTEWEIRKVVESLNASLHHVLINDVESATTDETGCGLRHRDYTDFITEYIDVVRDATVVALDNGGGMPNGARTSLMSRAFRAMHIKSRISNIDILETLNSILFDVISDDLEDDERRGRDYTTFLIEYVDIVSEAKKLSSSSHDAGGQSEEENRDIMIRAYKAGRLIGRST